MERSSIYVPDTPVYETVEPSTKAGPGWPENSTAPSAVGSISGNGPKISGPD
jgi:hypothetical protein